MATKFAAAALVLALALPSASAARSLRNTTGIEHATNKSAVVGLHGQRQTPTFMAWYDAYSTGRGIWKWQNALVAYQTHFERYAGQPVKILEVGVQSGGSIDMYKAVLGAQCHYYGMDINPATTKFADASATISILDQGQAPHWAHFFAHVVANVDILIDDGGHQAFQMLTTFQQALPHINPGGVHLIEDIHGQNEDYLTKLFNPAADYLATVAANVASVNLYPFCFVVQMSGGTFTPPTPATPAASFTTVDALMAALPNHPGAVLHLANPSWPTMFTGDGLKTIFRTFYELYGGTVDSQPKGCFSQDANTVGCTMLVTNTGLQNMVTGVDIYPTLVQVHTAPAPPSIYAARKGTEWIPYGL